MPPNEEKKNLLWLQLQIPPKTFLLSGVNSRQVPVKHQRSWGELSKATQDGNFLSICALRLEIVTESIQ